MRPRLLSVFLLIAVAAGSAAAQQERVSGWIDSLSSFDRTVRVESARQLRRVPAAEALAALEVAVLKHSDEYVRPRALTLLTSFNPSRLGELMEGAMRDRNDRLREVAFRWLEVQPNSRLAPILVAALNTERAEFVRPALIRAVAALDADATVQRALLTEANRGVDVFRSSVIEALGERRAVYAVDTIAAIARLDGPLQDDAVVALGRIGGPSARNALATFTDPPAGLVPALQAGLCFLGDACQDRIDVLKALAAGGDARAAGAVRALGLVAGGRDASDAAVAALVELASRTEGRLRGDVAVAFAGAALRSPEAMVERVVGMNEATRTAAVTLLHEGFDSLEEDFAEERFYTAARAAYWQAAEGSATRSVAATLIDELEF